MDMLLSTTTTTTTTAMVVVVAAEVVVACLRNRIWSNDKEKGWTYEGLLLHRIDKGWLHDGVVLMNKIAGSV